MDAGPRYADAIPVVQEESSFLSRVYGWMSVGLLITAAVAWWAYNSDAFLGFIAQNRWSLYGLMIAQLGLVIALSAAIERLSPFAAGLMFLVYSALTGLTFSLVFLVYTMSSIASTFLITSGTFAAVSFYGMTTKRDLSGWGTFLFMGLIGIIIASVVNFFFRSDTMSLVISYVGVFIFVGLTAYDTQRLLVIHRSGMATGERGAKLAIYGALKLYLDFINLFLMLLRIMGNRR